MMRKLLAFTFLLALPLHAQFTAVPPVKLAAFAGVVRDTLGHPLRMATVFVEGKDLSTVTDDSGRFHIARIPAGPNLVTALRIGYKAVSFEINLPPDSTIVAEIRLKRIQTLGAVTVTGERVSPKLAKEGFYTRMRQGWGSFLPPEKVEELQSLSTPAKMLRDVRGLEVRCGSAAGRCSVSGLPPHSCVSLFVNGSYTPAQLDDVLSSSEVYAFEVYNGTVPMEFQTALRQRAAGDASGCTAIVVWTQSRAP